MPRSARTSASSGRRWCRRSRRSRVSCRSRSSERSTTSRRRRSPMSEKSRLIAENDRTAKEIDTLKALLGQGANVKAQLADVRNRVKVIEELLQGQGRPVVLLDAFVDTVPRDLWITSFEDKGASLKIVGIAYSTRAVSEFMSNLRQSGKFKDVDILVSRQDLTKSPIMVNFEVSCRFEA